MTLLILYNGLPDLFPGVSSACGLFLTSEEHCGSSVTHTLHLES